MANKGKTSPYMIEAKHRRGEAVKLRLEGYTFVEIAEKLGYAGRQQAHASVMEALKSVVREPATELVTLELERLDAMWGVNYMRAQSGDPAALASCLKIMERRARLLGLDRNSLDLTNSDGSLKPPTAINIVPVDAPASE